jgi:hypothetical protein
MSLEIKKSSHGLGLFATRSYKEDEIIIEYFGNLLTNKEADNHPGRYIFALNATHSIDGSPRANTARYINHSCDPNVFASGHKRLWIRASRKIKAGEELTLDYGKAYIEAFIEVCKCPAHKKKKNKTKDKAKSKTKGRN